MQVNNVSFANRLSRIDLKEYKDYIESRMDNFTDKEKKDYNPIERMQQLQELLKG